ncbi:Dabb family protein [Sphingobium tyrosinilyticum]|uniref:Dabb family protein n=1 Tax=Sphingobium tyrosinilyticum TaxID=2715436 RepID=A0ABV9F4L6_9SPHN
MTQFVSLRFLTLPADRQADRDRIIEGLRAVIRELPGVQSAWIAPILPAPVIHAGQIVWRTIFATENDSLLAPIAPVWREKIAPLIEGAQITALGYRTTRMGVAKKGPGIWRALIFRTFTGADQETVRELESNLLLFPKYISTIKSWALSNVSTMDGPKGFTHVWEQEFDSVEGLLGEYMDHPLHWGVVDSYFDAELPQYIVEGHVIQAVAEIDGSIMQ